MTTRHEVFAGRHVDSGSLSRGDRGCCFVSHVSGAARSRIALGAYLEDAVVPSLTDLCCTANGYDAIRQPLSNEGENRGPCI